MTIRHKLRSSSAFTIVELLVVIVVIGILAAITIVSYTGISSRAVVSALQSDLTNALTQLKLDQVTNSMFPSSLSAANGGKGISSSSGTSYTYAYSNTTTPQTFCITATKNNISYNITGDGNPQPGICPVLNLDAGNVSSYPGTGTTWTDLSGNGNSGTLNGGVTYNASNGGALSFDGSTGYVSSNYISGIISNRITISAWIKPGSVSGTYEISNQAQWDGGPWTGWRFRQINNYINFKIGDGSSTSYDCSGGNLTSGTWYYTTGVWDGGYIHIYVNGMEVSNCAKSFTYLGNTGTHSVGKYGGSAYFFNGFIGNVDIYNVALSAPDILQNFNILRSRYGI